MSIWEPTNKKAHKELKELQEYIDQREEGVNLRPWDIAYYAEKVKKEKYQINSQEISEYLPLKSMVRALHLIAEQVFGLHFAPAENVSVFHPDVSVYRVKQKDTDQFVGYLFFDPFTRDGKKGGAWNTSYQVQQNFDGDVFPIYANNLNLMKPDSREGLKNSSQFIFPSFQKKMW